MFVRGRFWRLQTRTHSSEEGVGHQARARITKISKTIVEARRRSIGRTYLQQVPRVFSRERGRQKDPAFLRVRQQLQRCNAYGVHLGLGQ